MKIIDKHILTGLASPDNYTKRASLAGYKRIDFQQLIY